MENKVKNLNTKIEFVWFFLVVGWIVVSGLLFSGCAKKEEVKPEKVKIPTSSFPMGVGREKPVKVEPTYLPKNLDFKSYVSKYYQLIKSEKFDEAYKIAPTERRARDTLKNFAASLKSMPILSYEVGEAVVEGDKAEVKVVMQLGGMAQGSKWIVAWFFVKDKRKNLWEAVKTQSMPVK